MKEVTLSDNSVVVDFRLSGLITLHHEHVSANTRYIKVNPSRPGYQIEAHVLDCLFPYAPGLRKLAVGAL